MDYNKTLAELVEPEHAVDQPSVEDWQALETLMGLNLPSDYETLLSALGYGTIGREVILPNPKAFGGPQRYIEKHFIGFYNDAYRIKEAMKIKLFPDPGGLIYIASTGSGHDFFLGRGADGSVINNMIIIDYDIEVMHDTGLGFSEALFKLYKNIINDQWAKSLHSLIWPDIDTPFFAP